MRAAWAVGALAALACSGGGTARAPDARPAADAPGTPDAAPLADAAADAPVTPDAAPAVDAGSNPAQLWLAGINGSERNLELVDTGPPSPF